MKLVQKIKNADDSLTLVTKCLPKILKEKSVEQMGIKELIEACYLLFKIKMLSSEIKKIAEFDVPRDISRTCGYDNYEFQAFITNGGIYVD